jgi:alpha-mannosidase
VSDSENERTRKQWDFKRAFAVNAEKLSTDLLAQVLHAGAGNDAAAMVRRPLCACSALRARTAGRS